MQIEVLEQFFFDAGANAVAEERAVGHDDRGPARLRRAFELAHDELEEEQSSFGSLFIFGKVAEDASLFFAAERRVGHDDIDPVFVADFSQRESEGCSRINLRGFQSVQNKIHLSQQIRK